MDTFFHVLKKTLVASVFVMFAFVATYVPQQWNHVEPAHAGGSISGLSTEPTQILNKIQLLGIQAVETVSKVANQAVAWATGSLWTKEFVLDGIAWAIAKSLVSAMMQSLIDWINSGFKGSPMFVQDLQGFLLNTADRAAGEYIDSLGGLGSFICSPFRLDIQISVALQYQRSRIDQPAPTCTLSDIQSNLTDFISGTQGSFSEGGWRDWFEITSQPNVYTPYGATLAAEAGMQASIRNDKDEELAYLNFGDGFLSGEICEMVHGAGGTKEECFISKPGKVISEALNNNIDSSRQALITADEIDEVVAALMGQLAKTVFTGAAGLLGLSSGTGHTYQGFSGGSYMNQMATESTASTTDSIALVQEAYDIQETFNDMATEYQPVLSAFAKNTKNDADDRTAAGKAADEADLIIDKTKADMKTLENMLETLQKDGVTTTEVSEVVNTFISLDLYQETDVTDAKGRWDAIFEAAEDSDVEVRFELDDDFSIPYSNNFYGP